MGKLHRCKDLHGAGALHHGEANEVSQHARLPYSILYIILNVIIIPKHYIIYVKHRLHPYNCFSDGK